MLSKDFRLHDLLMESCGVDTVGLLKLQSELLELSRENRLLLGC